MPHETFNSNEDTLWVRRTISKIRLWWCTKRPAADQLVQQLRIVNSVDFRLIQAKDNASPYLRRLRVVYPSLDTYNRTLQWLTQVTQSNAPLPRNWCAYDFTDRPLAELFVDSKGLHVEALSSLVAFQHNAATFLRHLHALSKDESDVAAHNARVLLRFQQHLQELTHAFISYLHHE